MHPRLRSSLTSAAVDLFACIDCSCEQCEPLPNSEAAVKPILIIIAIAISNDADQLSQMFGSPSRLQQTTVIVFQRK